jgi:leucyl/phenylalanyl-tRNA--protein transferase
MPVYRLSDKPVFPPPELAEENGLLAIGGDLSPERLLAAYSSGIFPWFSKGEPILWWAPSPRLVIFPDEFRIPRRLARLMRQERFTVTFDTSFARVIEACAAESGRKEKGTWLTGEMIKAYCALHDTGFAHSVECWQGDKLAGGLYGVSLGAVFFGESMFSRETDSSKAALVALAKQLLLWEFDLIDCQMKTGHLLQFGAREIPGTRFQELLAQSMNRPTRRGRWQQG